MNGNTGLPRSGTITQDVEKICSTSAIFYALMVFVQSQFKLECNHRSGFFVHFVEGVGFFKTVLGFVF